MITTALSNKKFYLINGIISAGALIFLIWLIYFQEGDAEVARSLSILPAINATLNSISAILIILGIRAIKQKRELVHRNLMIGAFLSSTLFLICYVFYHSLHGDTKFLGEGWIRPMYFFILISHIILSAVMLPLILSSMFFGLTNRRRSHRKVAKWTYPIWLYVSITGVIIFFMLRAYS